MQHWSDDLDKIYSQFHSQKEGLDTNQFQTNRKKYGRNILIKKERNRTLKLLWAQFSNPLVLILIGVTVFSFITRDNVNGTVIFVMLAINAILGFSQEYKAQKSLEKLQKLIRIRSKVLRDGKIQMIEAEDIVPGDIVLINKGDYIPADIRLIESSNLSINEAALTGESMSVEKDFKKSSTGSHPQDIKNGVFQGTFVDQGYGKGIVVSIADDTFLGRSVQIGDKEQQKTNFVKKLDQFSNAIFWFVIFITTTSFIINVSLGRDVISSFILGITLSLGITPETMPVILSISLSNAALQLSKKKLLIKRLNVFEDLGNIDVICSDKTGTITKGILEPQHFFNIDFKEDEEVKNLSLVCNAYNPQINSQIMLNTIDEAIWNAFKSFKLNNFVKLNKAWDFDFNTRTMGILADFGDNHETLVVKGAYEILINNSNLNSSNKSHIQRKLKNYENMGYRIIGIGIKKSINNELRIKDVSQIKELTLIGFTLLMDSPREHMERDFNSLEKLNIHLKIITGDSPEVTKEICNRVGLNIVDNKVFSGDDLEELQKKSVIDFNEVVNKYNVFARVTPEQKLNIVQAIRGAGHVVGYIGDGINDVGALKIADVGISVDSGVDVAKDCADIIILERSLKTIAEGVLEGRKVFCNTMKFIFTTMSSSFGNVVTITFASIFLKFLPMLPIQVLLEDSLTDIQHLAISTDNVDEEMLDKPRNWDMGIFVKFSIYWGIIGTLFDFLHIYVITSVTSSPELFRTMWLIESILTELLATIAIRTSRIFWKSIPSLIMTIFSIVPFILILLVAYTSLGTYFGMVVPAPYLVGIVIIISGIYFVAMEFLKRSYFESFWGIKYK